MKGTTKNLDKVSAPKELLSKTVSSITSSSQAVRRIIVFDSLPYDLVVRDDRDFEARAKSFGSLENVVAREGVEIYTVTRSRLAEART